MNTFEKLLTASALVSNAPGSELVSESFALLQLVGGHRLLVHAADLLEDLGDRRRRGVGADAAGHLERARRCGGT